MWTPSPIEPKRYRVFDYESVFEGSELLLERDLQNKIGRITLNRPEKLNALTNGMVWRLGELCNEICLDESIKVLIIKAAGRAFTSGYDLDAVGPYYGLSKKEGEEKPSRRSQRRRLIVDEHYLIGRRSWVQALHYFNKPLIVQVQGYCYGGGLHMLLASDIAIAADNATFGHPAYSWVGPVCELAVWIETVGLKKAKEITFAGKPISAQEALDYRLVNKVVPVNQLEEATMEMALTIAQKPYDGLVAGKFGFMAAEDALGIGTGFATATLAHTIQTQVHYEPGEMNVLRERKRGGVKAAIETSRSGLNFAKNTQEKPAPES